MFNSDISLYWDIDQYYNISNGQVNCIPNGGSGTFTHEECSIITNSIYKQLIEEYSNNNTLFLKQFKKVWTKLITIGYENDYLELIVNTQTPSPVIDNTDDTKSNAYTQYHYIGILYYIIITIIIVITTNYCVRII